MITAKQAVQAAILCQIITRGSQPITTFRYYLVRKIIFIEAGFNREIAIEIYENGEWNYV